MIGKKVKVNLEKLSDTLKDNSGQPQVIKSEVDLVILDKVRTAALTKIGFVEVDSYIGSTPDGTVHMIEPNNIVKLLN